MFAGNAANVTPRAAIVCVATPGRGELPGNAVKFSGDIQEALQARSGPRPFEGILLSHLSPACDEVPGGARHGQHHEGGKIIADGKQWFAE